MSLYFVRHGESIANEQNLFAGRFDSPLTELGRRQARKAARSVEAAGLRFDVVHVSPLSRARETAELIVAGQTCSFIESEELIERDFGRLSENNKSLIKKHFGHAQYESMFHSADGKPPAGETFPAMYERVLRYYRDVLLPASVAGQCVLVVAHKYIIEMFALIAADLQPKDYFDFKIPNSKPNSFDELARHVRSSPQSVHWLGEVIEIHLPLLMLGTAALGIALKQILRAQFGSTIFFAMVALFLAVNSFIAFLRVETDVLKGAFGSLRHLWKGALLRGVLGIALLVGMRNPAGFAAGIFLLLPPSMTAPTLSLMWDGDYYLSVQSTVVLSLLCPLTLGAVSLASHALGWGIDLNLGLFIALFSLGVALPGLAAQVSRVRSPIRAGAISTNWGWLGGAALIPLALLSGYHFAPIGLAITLPELLFTLALFLSIRVTGALSSRLSSGSTALKRDLYICQVVPNIFLWFALLPVGGKVGAFGLLANLLYFASLYLEERRFVRSYGAGFKRQTPSILCPSGSRSIMVKL